MKAEQRWAHGAFFDYCDHWMDENETEALKTQKRDANMDEPDWGRKGKAWEPFVDEMWTRYRTTLGLPLTSGW